MTPAPSQWTHQSVLAFSKQRDPVQAVTERAREITMNAMDIGWSGPPFDPLALADLLEIEVIPRDDVREAQTVATERGKPRIEYNPTRPRGRLRYSLAHEIAHTLFPDWAEQVRKRAPHSELEGDDWQLEALCNIAAAEFVMPIGSFTDLATPDVGVDVLLEEQKRYEVSMEAILIRAVHLRSDPCAMFCASPIEKGGKKGRYRIDYLIGSRAWKPSSISRGWVLPERTLVAHCSAIGFTSKGDESWTHKSDQLHVEALGIPPYPGSLRPRVVGLLRTIDEGREPAPELVEYVIGDATEPRGDGPKLIVHIVTDAAITWGGSGFAAAVRRAWPMAQDEFRLWVGPGRKELVLGNVHFSSVREDVDVASVVAQHGYGASAQPRVRYNALREGLRKVSTVARKKGATVHMPKIGTGQAGGSWDVVEELIRLTLCEEEVHVTVYELPGSRLRSPVTHLAPRPDETTQGSMF